ncbi:FtsB family cell division protein [Cohnella laeviribosi]|uniref:FtsB family cell division protein n=1 Tax=Cohnella laeviribosi TaxID=380174 RepID=UPI003D2585C6
MASNTMSTPASVGARRRLKLLFLVVALFMSWAAYTMLRQYHQEAERTVKLREMKDKLAEAEAKTAALKLEVKRLNDPEYVGQIARKDQGMMLPGEREIQIKP